MMLSKESETIARMAEAIITKHHNVPMRLWLDRGMGGPVHSL